ncbi:Ketol-acid reductoisomerase (NADP(+)) [Geodia barretti]|nr:Ketol-acid reductoisomerase (NADP(+)) [Geodia barretti]
MARHRPGLCAWRRVHPSRRAGHDLQGGDGDRPVRRAVRPLRRRHGADQGRVRDAGGGRVPAGVGLLRVHARAEADRRPALPGRHGVHEVLGQRHGRVRRLLARPGRDRRARQGEHEAVLEAVQDGSFAREWIAENDEGRPRFDRLRKENAEHPIESVGKELRGMMSFLKEAD